ncbi:hypothetical protein FOL47_009905, partial [Perkinsus chesapeaki]
MGVRRSVTPCARVRQRMGDAGNGTGGSGAEERPSVDHSGTRLSVWRLSSAVLIETHLPVEQPVRPRFSPIEPQEAAASSFQAFGRLNELLGLVVKQERDVGPSDVAKVLARAIHEGLPGGSAGRKLAGRLSFACSVLRGRCGRAYVRTIIRGTYGHAASDEMRTALRGVARMLATTRQGGCGRGVEFTTAVVPPDEPRTHVVLYADATGDGEIAAVATAADSTKVWYSKGQVPEWFKLQLSERENQVMAFELYAVAAAIETYCVDPRRSYLVCTDSEVVRKMVSRGSGKPADMNAVVGRMWDRLANGLVSVYFCRVASEANPADGPSRGLPVSSQW